MNNQKIYRSLSVVALVVVAGLLAACGTPAAATPATPDEVALQMSWVFDYSASPFLVAEKNGHFATENLKVSIEEGGFGEGGYIEPIDQVLAGKADFGLASASTLIQARAAGKPVVAVMSVLQRSPFALISLEGSNITKPSDLAGKTVTVSEGGAMDTYLAFLAEAGIDPASINTIPRTDFGIDPLLNGDVDVLAGWIINEGVMVEEAGETPNFILPSDYGIEGFDFVVFTTDDTIKNRPEIVERFVRAVIGGINDVVADSSKAIDVVMESSPDLDRDQQQRRLDSMLALIRPAGSQVGAMQSETWETTQIILVQQGSLSAPISLSTVFTLDFLNKIYGQ
jgi:NitT/TauT family transport system substrate-binding protein